MKTIPCELCHTNILKGLVHKIHGVYVCNGCKCCLAESDGEYFNGRHTRAGEYQCVRPESLSGATVKDESEA